MDKEYLRELFDKYARNECSDKEIELLDSYLDSFRDKESLWSELDYDRAVKEGLWSSIKSDIRGKEIPVKRLYRGYLKYAAVFIGLIAGLAIWHQKSTSLSGVGNIEVIAKDSPVILKMPGKGVVEIDAEGNRSLADNTGKLVAQYDGGQISYAKNDRAKELVYNEVIVPNGKKFKIIFSDGTLAHVNSGSSLRYPANFVPDKERQVFLEGEAYFEVAKDTSRPFLVTSPGIGVKVLGTHFVVSSYKESENFAVLAEGSVAVYSGQTGEDPTIIAPGEKATIGENNVAVRTVQIDDYLGWMEGRLIFNDERFAEIVHKIERHYGVEIQNDYAAMDSKRFQGKFRDETITDLLDAFKESAGFHYEIRDNKVIIDRSLEE
ncbi:FecR domain-containing protein [uncultured Kriegella sp.]|mgnify:CR=1 FL=1|uniref:FecR family protein n=1 Tax=uncultured Kriegella sp. TaxID=1798910 RepID=UPI0030D887C6|tara:strand:+ start:159398 stop:160531 length:1134 start_codon:yes stop_codon:yes gene_type:complete